MLEDIPSSGSWGKGTMAAPIMVLEERQRGEEVGTECQCFAVPCVHVAVHP